MFTHIYVHTHTGSRRKSLAVIDTILRQFWFYQHLQIIHFLKISSSCSVYEIEASKQVINQSDPTIISSRELVSNELITSRVK